MTIKHIYINVVIYIYVCVCVCVCMHSYLCCKSSILVPDDGPQVPKHVAFTDDITRLLRLTLTNKSVLLTQHDGMNSIKIYFLPLVLRPRTQLTSF